MHSKCVKKNEFRINLPVLALTDGDAHGFQILCAYKYGSTNIAYDGKNLTTPNIYWFGVRPSDATAYKIPKECIKPLSVMELELVSRLKDNPFLKKHFNLITRLELMLETKQKIDTRDANQTDVMWLAETYLPLKLKSLKSQD